jgi:sulfoxide reductase heme-binding subunit YedZ
MVNTLNGWLRKVPAWPIYVVGVAWAAWLFYQALTGALGAEPINALERLYGELALQLIVVGLLITPLRNWFGVNLIKFRRAVGVITFFFVLAHFLVWVILDVGTLERVWTEIVKRPYVTIGFASFLMLIPLAITSNNLSLRKIGPQRWRKLHKLTYPAAILAVLHYIWLVKGWPLEPFVYLAIILGLLALRIRLKPRTATA